MSYKTMLTATYLLFLKMADDGKRRIISQALFDNGKRRYEFFDHYRHLLEKLGQERGLWLAGRRTSFRTLQSSEFNR